MGGAAAIVKKGDGPLITDGAVVRVHYRSALRLADLDNDALVADSTYGRRDPVVLRVDRDVVRAPIFEALVGIPVGSTVVVSLETGESDDDVFVELWIVDVQDRVAGSRSQIIAVHVGVAPEIRSAIRDLLNGGRQQQNGVAVRVSDIVEPSLLDMVEDIRRDTGLPAPYRLRGAELGQVGTVDILLSPSLHAALLARLDDTEGD